MKRWPLFLIAAPAAVAVWSGWVGLGQLCGFGLVEPLPGIAPWHLNTAITLPIGVEAYASFALGAWLTPGTPDRARTFARRSAVGALALGMTGQVVYHLLAAAHAAKAPWPVVVLVACLPVVTLGFGVALAHLLREHAPGAAPAGVPAAPVTAPAVSASAPADAPGEPATAPGVPGAHLNGSGVHPGEVRPFADELARGEVPSLRRIRTELRVGQPKAQEIQARLSALTRNSVTREQEN